ncbi:non-ribosomal peptide synthetase [Streptomyces sp. KLOTTS4A1]|uniref:non-ribosomal peptide synthetase n=1 Tax=Streptomyces sp. KLOTTS4A1 TaxID=3390996 RepID=UPI0039F59AA3
MPHVETPRPAAPLGAVTEVSRAQEGMLAVEDFLTGRPSPFHVLNSAEITGPLDVGRLSAVLETLVRRHRALRTVFVRDPETGALGCRTVPDARPRIITQDLPEAGSAGDVRELVDRLLTPMAPRLLRPFAEPPVVFVVTEAGEHRWVLSVLGHHAVLDGFSLGLLWQQIASGYATAEDEAGDAAEAPGMEVFLAEEQALGAAERAAAVEARAGLLARWPSVTEIPGELPRPAVRTFAGARLPFTLGEAAEAGCRRLAAAARVSRNVVLLAAWTLAVARQAGTDRMVMGVPTLGRTSESAMQVVGGATGLDAIACDLPDDIDVAEYLRRTARASREPLRYSGVAFEDIVAALDAGGDLGRNPLVQFVFAAQNSVVPEVLTADGLRFDIRVGHTGGTMYDAMLHVMRWGQAPRLELEYATDVLTSGEAARLAVGFEQALTDMATAPDRPLAELTTVTERQRRLLERWGHGARDDERTGLWQLVEQSARQHPETVAVRDRDGRRAVTYRQLMAAVDAQSALLAEAGVGVGDCVALALPRSAEEIVAVLATLRIGACYVGVDAESPAATIASTLAQAGVRVVLGTADRLDALDALDEGAGERTTMAVVDPLAPPATASVPAAPAHPDRTACLGFTSGTTGTPKGAMVPCRGVVRLARDAGLVLPRARARFVRLAPLAFDASTLEIFTPLLAGGTVEVYPEGHVAPDEMAAFLERHRVTGMFLTSGLFRLVVDYRPDAFRGMVQVLTGGDAISPPHVEALLTACPGVRVSNGYGPTECTTITATFHIDDPSEIGESGLPIGRPIRNTDVRVVGTGGHPVPPGSPGELIVYGPAVASGYVARPEETAAAFGRDGDGRRFYRTGDLVRWDSTGNLWFLGRRDRQVKIRGFRVETESIVEALRRQPGVRDATVIVVPAGNGDKQLLAGVVGDGAALRTGDLRSALARVLPSYALPHLWAVVDALPLRKNGKLDTAALTSAAAPAGRAQEEEPAPTASAPHGRVHEEPEPEDAAQAPVSSDHEEVIARAWRKVLGHQDFGRDDWFLDVGGDSLSMIRVYAILNAALPERNLTVEDLYTCATINELAAHLRSAETVPA